MIRTYEAVIDPSGTVKLLEPLRLPLARKALVTILEEAPNDDRAEGLLLSERSLAEGWANPEDDEAWSHLQQAR